MFTKEKEGWICYIKTKDISENKNLPVKCTFSLSFIMHPVINWYNIHLNLHLKERENEEKKSKQFKEGKERAGSVLSWKKLVPHCEIN